MKIPELLLPVGGLERIRAAYDYSVSAAYADSPRYSLRACNNELAKLDVLEQGTKEAHERNKRFFLTVNTLPHNSKLKTFVSDMEPLTAMKPDALIMADPGLIMAVHEKWPEMPIHLSVQTNTTNYWGVKFWQNIGVERIILSRGSSMEETAETHQEYPDTELKVSAHGTLCTAYSGRCLLSGYFNHRSPNQGTCTSSCRWDYKICNTVKSDAGGAQLLQGFNPGKAQGETNQNFEGTNDQKRHPYVDKVFLIEESNRPGEMISTMGDEHGTYIMNSKDLRSVEVVEKPARTGVGSLGVEGCVKSLYYVAYVVQSYHKTIDDVVAGRPFDHSLLNEFEGLVNCGYTSGFLERHQIQDYQDYPAGHSIARQSQYVGHVVEADENGWAIIKVKNRFAADDSLEIIHPSGNQTIKLEQMTRKDQPVDVALGNDIQVKISNMQDKKKALVARITNP